MWNQAELSGSGSLSPAVGSHAFWQTTKKHVSESRIEVLRGVLSTTETLVEADLWQQAWTAMQMESEVRLGFKSRLYHL